MSTKTARELAKKTSDAHTPAPKLQRSGVPNAMSTEMVPKQEQATAASSTDDTGPLSMSQVLATLRGEMVETKNMMRSERLKARVPIDNVCTGADSMQESVDRAFAPTPEAMECHETTLVEHGEHIKTLDQSLKVHNIAMEQFKSEVLALRTAQSAAEATDVRQEAVMPPDAPPPPLPRSSSGWDRILQANAIALSSTEALVASLTPLGEAANLSLDDIDIKIPSGTTMANALVVELRAAILREVADITGKHCMGLRQLERDQRVRLSAPNRRRLVALDLARGVVRHITSASSRSMLRALRDEFRRDPSDVEEIAETHRRWPDVPDEQRQ